MSNKVCLNNEDVASLARVLAETIGDAMGFANVIMIYPIPRGGIPVAYMLCAIDHRFTIVNNPTSADICVDDIIDSGATAKKYRDLFNIPTFALIDKTSNSAFAQQYKNKWIVFPRELSVGGTDESFTDNVVRLLQYVGENPSREGLLETPQRVAKAWREWCSGYNADPLAVLKSFEDGADGCDEMIIVRDIPFYSHCEHHLAPFFGTATVTYIPNGKIIGLSKIPRIVDIFARRLQVQERLTNQIADTLQQGLDPKGVGVIINARHLCMESRGICQQGHSTMTSALRGVLRTVPEARAEFLALAAK